MLDYSKTDSTDSSAISNALWALRRWHMDQLYGEENYVDGHLLKVAELVTLVDLTSDMGRRTDHILLALHHDSFEDGVWLPGKTISEEHLHVLYKDILSPYRINKLCAGVRSLTRDAPKQTYERYIDTLVNNQKFGGVQLVKICDLCINLRSPGKAHLKSRYEQALDRFKSVANLTVERALKYVENIIPQQSQVTQ